LFGIILMVLAMLLLPFMDAIVKFLSNRYPILQLIWARFFFHFLIILPCVVFQYGRRVFHQAHPLKLLSPGLFLLGGTGLFFVAIQHLPLADAIAILFFDAVIVVALSSLVLGEQVPLRRWLACAVGFIAILMIVRPGGAGFHWASLLALAAALFWALYFVSTRMMSGKVPPLVMLGWQSVSGFVLLTAALPYYWVTPTLADGILMALIGATGAAGHLLFIQAFSFAQASLLAPLRYLEIVMQVVLGYWLFGDYPDLWAWAGIALIIGVGVYLGRAELTHSTSGKHQLDRLS
jgi:drug/metabolite transporter (DMT)-like permease